MGETDEGPAPLSRHRRRRRALTRLGGALVVAGVMILAYVGWELYGTTWLAQRDQARTVEAAERLWSERPVSKQEREAAKEVVALVRIPALGEDFVVPAFRGTDDDTLERGFGIFTGSARPGAAGNFVLGGHRVTHGEPLREMPSLGAGDRIIVETEDATYRYVLDTDGDSRTVDTDSGWVTTAAPVDPETGRPVSDAAGSTRLLTLVTCAEIFHTEDRLVAFGHLISRSP